MSLFGTDSALYFHIYYTKSESETLQWQAFLPMLMKPRFVNFLNIRHCIEYMYPKIVRCFCFLEQFGTE